MENVNVIIVWSNEGEVTLYEVPMQKSLFEKLKVANDKFFGYEMTDEQNVALEYINLSLTSEKDSKEEYNVLVAEAINEYPSMVGKWVKLKMSKTTFMIPADYVISCGCYL